jgi:hypothetical protein
MWNRDILLRHGRSFRTFETVCRRTEYFHVSKQLHGILCNVPLVQSSLRITFQWQSNELPSERTRHLLGDQDLDRGIINKLVLKRIWVSGLGPSDLGYGPLAGCCEHCDEPSCSVKDVAFICQLSNCQHLTRTAPWSFLASTIYAHLSRLVTLELLGRFFIELCTILIHLTITAPCELLTW